MKLYNEILAVIGSLGYKGSSQLLSEHYLNNGYYVSQTTVRVTLSRLSQDGYIYTVHGNASFVQPQVPEQPLNGLYSFTDELKNNNILTHDNLIDYQVTQLGHMLVQKLNYPIQSAFHRLIRLRSAQNYPLMSEATYLPKGRFHQLSIEPLKNKGSLCGYLKRRYDFHVDHAIETFRPIMADHRKRESPQISSSIPCQSLERYNYEEDSIAEYTHSVIRGGKYTFRVDLK